MPCPEGEASRDGKNISYTTSEFLKSDRTDPDKKNGYVVTYRDDGRVEYEGNWKNGMFHGKGLVDGV